MGTAMETIWLRGDLAPEQMVSAWATDLEEESAEAIISEAFEHFGDDLVLACSFGSENIVLIDLVSKIYPQVQAVFLDTDFHFPETLELKDKIQARYPEMRLQVIKPLISVETQDARHGEKLYERNPDLCCAIRKVEPFNRALAPFRAWMTGMRREQSLTRRNIGVVQWDGRREMVKFCPLARWSEKQIWKYIVENKLPYNPLHDQGYPSIGCSPLTCTAPVATGADPRSGRWAGKAKTECGLHL